LKGKNKGRSEDVYACADDIKRFGKCDFSLTGVMEGKIKRRWERENEEDRKGKERRKHCGDIARETSGKGNVKGQRAVFTSRRSYHG